jgi:hypothetical protein
MYIIPEVEMQVNGDLRQGPGVITGMIGTTDGVLIKLYNTGDAVMGCCCRGTQRHSGQIAARKE